MDQQLRTSAIDRLVARLGAVHRDEGQTAAEYLGVVVVIAAIIAALASQAGGIGGTIKEAVDDKVEEISGMDQE